MHLCLEVSINIVVTMDDLDKSSVWKWMVDSCVCTCGAGVRTHVFNMFVSSAKRARLQRQKWSSPDQHKTRSSLAMNTFVCSVMSCSEVSSRGCFGASGQHVRLQDDIEFGGETSCILKVGLETHQKRTETRGKSF